MKTATTTPAWPGRIGKRCRSRRRAEARAGTGAACDRSQAPWRQRGQSVRLEPAATAGRRSHASSTRRPVSTPPANRGKPARAQLPSSGSHDGLGLGLTQAPDPARTVKVRVPPQGVSRARPAGAARASPISPSRSRRTRSPAWSAPPAAVTEKPVHRSTHNLAVPDMRRHGLADHPRRLLDSPAFPFLDTGACAKLT